MTIQSTDPENPVRKGDFVVYHGSRSATYINPPRYVREEFWTSARVESAKRNGAVNTVSLGPNSIPIEAHGSQILVPAPDDPRIEAIKAHYEDPEKQGFPDLDALRSFLSGHLASRSEAPVR